MPTQLQSRGTRTSRQAESSGSQTAVRTVHVRCEGALPIVFDRQHALARLGGLDDILREVFQVMAVETPKMHAAIVAALDRRNAVELQRAAHTLKGSASIVGAKDLTRRLKCVEGCAEAENFAAAAAELGEIDRQFARLTTQLAEELSVG